MRRPFALVGFTYLLTLAVAVTFGAGSALVLACVTLALFGTTLAVKRLRSFKAISVALLVMSISFGSYAAQAKESLAPARALDGKDAVVSGTICELPVSAYGHTYYVLQTDKVGIDGAVQQLKIRLSTSHGLKADVYDHVEARVHLYSPGSGEGFSSSSYYASKGIYLLSYLYEYEPVTITPAQSRPVYYYALKLRDQLLTSINGVLPPEQSSMVNGVLLGDTSGLSDAVISDFRDTGTSHILSVSGLHMAALTQMLFMLLLFFKVPKRGAAGIIAVCLFLFMAVTGFVPSVVRAGVMTILYLAGLVFGREADALNSLGLSVLVLCFFNPFAGGDVSLLLTFAATLGLILFAQKWNVWIKVKSERLRFGKRFAVGLGETVAVTFAATVLTLPIVILFFGRVSLIAPLGNILELLPSTLLMQTGLAAALLLQTGPLSFLAMPFVLASGLLAKYLTWCSGWLSKIPYASISASQGYVLLWIAFTMLLLGLAVLLRGTKQLYKVTALLSAILLLCGMLSYELSTRNVIRLTAVDTGDGCAVVLTQNGRAAVLSCGGGSCTSTAVTNTLRAQGISRIDCLVLPDYSKYSYSDAESVINRFKPSAVLTPPVDGQESLSRALKNASKSFTYYSSGTVSLWDSTEITVLNQGSSGALFIKAGDVTALVCPSGIEADSLPEEYKAPDFLITSKLPENVFDLSPNITVLSMSQENAALMMQPLAAQHMNPMATGGDGSVVIDIYPNREVAIRREN